LGFPTGWSFTTHKETSGAINLTPAITFGRLASSYWIDNLGFLLREKACCYIHHTLLLGFSNWPVIYSASSVFVLHGT
jgi:hypothetical protein